VSDGRFTPRARSEADLSIGHGEDDRREKLAESRLSETLRELTVCLDDGRRITEMGRARLDEDWLVQRAARNVIAELGETVGRLPERFRTEHPAINWSAIAGMRNRTVHAYQHTSYQIVWDTLTVDLPRLAALIERR
jgi:uncharacterized protein with HEPN domain